MEITRTSCLTGVTHTMNLDVNPEDLAHYNAGCGLIQEVFPHLTPDEREFIKTGITPEEWDRVFGG